MSSGKLTILPNEPAPEQIYEENLRKDAPIRLGLLHNPRAGRTKRWVDRMRLGRFIPESDRMITTQHESEVPAALRELILKRRVNVIAIHGGDGTIHTVVNALWKFVEELDQGSQSPIQLPSILFLHGGTMNMTARAVGVRGSVQRNLRRFMESKEGEPYGSLDTQPLGVLRVQGDKRLRRGLIFGSELVHNAIELHRHFGDGYIGLGRLLLKASVGATLNTPSWRHFAHLLSPPESPLDIDGLTYPRYGAVVASTVNLQLARGWIESLNIQENSTGFSSKLILETNRTKLVQLIPSLLRNQGHKAIENHFDTTKMKVRGAYTLDGELFRAEAHEICTITRERETIPAIASLD